MSIDPDLKEIVWLGDEAEKFIRSPLGGYVLGCARRERDRAIEALTTADPADADTVRRLQSDIARARSFPAWLNELIFAGEKAYEDIVAEQSSD